MINRVIRVPHCGQILPAIDVDSVEKNQLLNALAGHTVVFFGQDELNGRLRIENFDVFVNPYGSAFPGAAWLRLLAYLTAGGNRVNSGGSPFSIPVLKTDVGWQAEIRQNNFAKQLLINQSFPVSTDNITSYRTNPETNFALDLPADFRPRKIFALYPRFTSRDDYPNEPGTPGQRDARLDALVYGANKSNDRVAAPVVQIDRLQGAFAGGRWALANFAGRINQKMIRSLVESAGESATEFVVRPNYASYRAGETPNLSIVVNRPEGNTEGKFKKICEIEISNENGRIVGHAVATLTGANETLTGNSAFDPAERLAPGFYRVRAKLNFANQSGAIRYTSGFWIYDSKLLDGGEVLTRDRDFLLRDGRSFPVIGTTCMASEVHRKFLFEPNAHVFDRDFAEMKRAGINMVRAGIWTGWKNVMLDTGQINEAVFRAIDAFLTTARKYDIPVIFCFFALDLPERKLALSLGASGAGAIRRIWNTNVYMTSDNEAAIGAHRADSTEKPELEPLRDFAGFANRHAEFFKGKKAEEVLLVIPTSLMYSVRGNYADGATRRMVRVMEYNCRTPVRAVGEYQLELIKDVPKLIVIPGVTVFNERARQNVLRLVTRGSTPLVTGAIDRDEYWLPVDRSVEFEAKAIIRPVAAEESLMIDNKEYHLSFRGSKIQSLAAADFGNDVIPAVKTKTHGNGKIIWSPLPAEDADNFEATVALYRSALRESRIEPIFTTNADVSVLIRPNVFAGATLYTVVSEGSRAKAVNFIDRNSNKQISVRVPAGRAALLLVNHKTGVIVGSTKNERLASNKMLEIN